MNPGIVSNLWLLPAVPFAAAVVILSLRKSRRKGAAVLAIGSQMVVLAISILAFLPTLQTNGFRAVQNFTWFTFGEQTLRLGFVLDPLAAAMLVMISLVGLCIFVFSVGYMADDKNFPRFFAYLSFFSGAMLGVVIANSLLLLFMFWELVGLASYLLIGFWIERPSAAEAAKKAFITTRIGDMAFFLGMLWLYNRSGTLLFYDGGRGCLEGAGLALLGVSATFIALLIFCGAVGKSGQFPLHVWLPDAMEGPTPVSALIHAATMVAAGVFLVARVYPLFSLGAINGVTSSLTVVVWIGVTTALMAALIAIAQADIKRILAYSTVSQLGLMMVSLGVGGVAAGIMHLLAHGFFQGASVSRLWLGDSRMPWRTGHSQNGRPAAPDAGDVWDVRDRYDGVEWRTAILLRWLDQGGNSSRHRALAAIASTILPDAGWRRSHGALHDAANDLRLFR
jgi:NADH-quinone oxidoreductase subunit L